MKRFGWALLLLLFVVPLASAGGVVGYASWYGKPHHGRVCANGERFNQWGLTAAHRSLPFGTRVRVKCFATGREVVLTITDRGPYRTRRILDVSRAAARVLGFERRGVAKIHMEEEMAKAGVNIPKMRPCPWCGFVGEVELVVYNGQDWFVAKCPGPKICPVCPKTRLCLTKDEAIMLWNDRKG